MKASEFITHLQQMIEEHGDLPLALMEVDYDTGKYVFIESGEIEIYNLDHEDIILNEDDEKVYAPSVFLID